jgi:hypothetical protein
MSSRDFWSIAQSTRLRSSSQSARAALQRAFDRATNITRFNYRLHNLIGLISKIAYPSPCGSVGPVTRLELDRTPRKEEDAPDRPN